MPIVIKKKAGRAIAKEPVASQGLTAQAERTDKEVLDSWKQVPPPTAKPRDCKFCGKSYIMPCDEEMRYKNCLNWQHLQKVKQVQASKEAQP